MKILLLDNFDSFTYNLLDYLRQLGTEVFVRRNDTPLAELLELPFEAVVLSPGPGRPHDAGVMPALLAQVYAHVPVLGICLGYQAIGELFGAELGRGARPMHGKVGDITVIDPQEPLFAGLPARLPVTRYHSLVLRDLPAALVPLAYAADETRELMALRHRSLPLYGLQFHPEALLTTHGLELLRNWVRIVYHCTKAAPGIVGSVHS